ncbi:MAG: hypothetical protein P4L40_21810 [Terracidiphilus sp.]|nr:hypothetical protein [Terracidiphilus sp.]
MRHLRTFLVQATACWNWKCALLSATVRSLVYLAALAHDRRHSGPAIVAVEIVYVSATAGLYAGLQQRALALRSQLLGNFLIVVGVPGVSQLLDWFTHRAVGSAAPPRAMIAVCIFSLISALFHLYVMRRGVFLTGRAGRSLADDFRRMPRMVLGFLLAAPMVLAGLLRMVRPAVSEPVL